MKLNLQILFTIGHNTKQVYLCMSEYSSKHHKITDIQQLLKWLDVKHTDPQSTNKSINNKKEK
jgi:hypothetical protein